MAGTTLSPLTDLLSEGGTLLRDGLVWAIYCRPGQALQELERYVVAHWLTTCNFPPEFAEGG